jgi:hypothetical protein
MTLFFGLRHGLSWGTRLILFPGFLMRRFVA